MEAQPRILLTYQTADGHRPFDDWYLELKDPKTRLVIRKRINRLALGNLGDCKALQDGIFKLRIDYGPGFRLYFAQADQQIVLLQLGGDKSTQVQDIRKAKDYYDDYKASS